MANDAYNYTASTDYCTLAYQQAAYLALRPKAMYDSLCDVYATEQSHRGRAVQFNILGIPAIDTTPLQELVDVDLEQVSDTTLTLTLDEYGKAFGVTEKLQAEAFIEFDPALARLCGVQAALTIDEVAREVMQAGSCWGTPAVATAAGRTARDALTSADSITANDVRNIRAYLARNNAIQFDPSADGNDGEGGTVDFRTYGGGASTFAGMIHPDNSAVLMSETGQGAWIDAFKYTTPSNIWNGEIGKLYGIRFIENSRAPYFTNAGAGGENVYGTLFLGAQAFAKVWGKGVQQTEHPTFVTIPQVDRLRRFSGIGWKWLGGYGIFRQVCVYRLESTAPQSGLTLGGDQPIINL